MKKVEIVILSIIGLIAVTTAKPQGLGFLTFKDGKIGVNFGGYHAEAGLGGLLGGGHTAGGLSASAGTPFGANAQAGLGGVVDGNGYTGGRLHASAGLGPGNPQAAAGIGGEVAGQGTQGGYYAGSTTGGASVSSVKTHSFGLVQPSEVGKVVEKEFYHSEPGVQHEKKTGTRYTESLPDLSQKTVESHVYQSIPVQPSVITSQQKVSTRITPHKEKTVVTTTTKFSPSVQTGVTYEKTVHPGGNWTYREVATVQTNAVKNIHYSYPIALPASSATGVNGGVNSGVSGGVSGNAGISGGAIGSESGGANDGNYEHSYYVKSEPNAQLFDDIFNIPISTLTAVNQLLKNKAT